MECVLLSSLHTEFQAVLLETLQNMETVKSISGANTLRNRWKKSVDEQLFLEYVAQKLSFSQFHGLNR